jgi:chemotaxis protein MotB
MSVLIARRTLPALFAALGLAACVPESQYDNLQAAYRDLQSKYNADEATIQMLQNQLKVTMSERVLFPSGGYELSESARRTLLKMVPTLKGLQNSRVIVEGYTDNAAVGPELRRQGIASNIDLSSRRADTVADALVRGGVPRGLVSADGRGDANPIAPNTTAAGRAQNRRIEVTIAGPGN